jgi:hypothetical protein
VFAQKFNGLAYDGLVEFALGVDGIAPKCRSHQSYAGYGQISHAFEGPMN